MLTGLKSAIEDRLHLDEPLLLIVHFPDTFAELQDVLAEWEFDYQILDHRISPIDLKSQGHFKLVLGLAELLIDENHHCTAESDQKLSVIVAERHPSGKYDARLESYFRSARIRIDLGYLLSFEDATLKSIVNESALKIFDMFGMGENELVTSNMISRRIDRSQKRIAREVISNHPAESAEAWLKRNRSS
ncbi:MAG: hypothetical protein AAGA30_05520 [Planctomycetota bacterium]